MSSNNTKEKNQFFSKISGSVKKLTPKHLGVRKTVAFALAGVIVAGTVISVNAMGTTARIVDGENVVSVLTFNGDTDNILQSAGILCDENDLIVSNKNSSRSIDITVYRAFDVTVDIDGEVSQQTFNRGTVKDALETMGVELDENDIVSPDMASELKPDMKIEVNHINRVSIKADGNTVTPVVIGATVAQALESAGVEIGEDDIVEPARDEAVKDGTEIVVKRVKYKESKKTKAIDFEIESTESGDMYIGETKVTQYGKEGKKEVVSRTIYVDGKKGKTEVVSEKVLEEPVKQVQVVGTKKKQISSGTVTQANGKLIDSNGNEIAYKQMISGSCTAYTATGNLTATGEVAQVGRVAVNPNVIPYGTKMYIASPDGSVVYGYCTASDTGGALMDGYVLVDLYYDTVDECYQFGRRTMNVYILG